MIDGSYAERLERDAAEFRSIAKDVASLTGDVVECRQTLSKIASEHPSHPSLSKCVDPAVQVLSKFEGSLGALAEQLDRLVREPIPLQFRRPAKQAEERA